MHPAISCLRMLSTKCFWLPAPLDAETCTIMEITMEISIPHLFTFHSFKSGHNGSPRKAPFAGNGAVEFLWQTFRRFFPISQSVWSVDAAAACMHACIIKSGTLHRFVCSLFIRSFSFIIFYSFMYIFFSSRCRLSPHSLWNDANRSIISYRHRQISLTLFMCAVLSSYFRVGAWFFIVCVHWKCTIFLARKWWQKRKKEKRKHYDFCLIDSIRRHSLCTHIFRNVIWESWVTSHKHSP